MTFLQLSATYSASGSRAVSWFSSGTGAAGLGALFWWFLRQLGPRLGLGLVSVLPLAMAATFFTILPKPHQLLPVQRNSRGYEQVAVDEEDNASPERQGLLDEEEEDGDLHKHVHPTPNPLTLARKIRLLRPLLWTFMLPLFLVYVAEYSINQGVSPSLVWALPPADTFWGSIITGLRDYYVLWQVIYQIFVFFSRSWISIFRLPPLPRHLLPLPSMLQCLLLCLFILEAWKSWITALVGPGTGPLWLSALLIAIEGLCGGSAYAMTYHYVGMSRDEDDVAGLSLLPPKDEDELRREKEFRLGAVGVADTFGILVASLISTAIEPWLCQLQVNRGVELCRQV
ncbi:hypothetical protein BT69DRAFT_1289334 [Atractiella rhizophila]|nr:hypothetical protein BT69DRAFT_1289334 [Atractiella rhizophila]